MIRIVCWNPLRCNCSSACSSLAPQRQAFWTKCPCSNRVIRANRKFEWFVRIGLTRYKNRGFSCEWFARIDSRESGWESPVPLRLSPKKNLKRFLGYFAETTNFRRHSSKIPAVPQGHKDRVTTLGKSRATPQTRAETRGDPAEHSKRPPQRPLRTLWEANFLGEPRGGLCASDGEPPELKKKVYLFRRFWGLKSHQNLNEK